jgi:hypothetical protein
MNTAAFPGQTLAPIPLYNTSDNPAYGASPPDTRDTLLQKICQILYNGFISGSGGALTVNIPGITTGSYETVAASQTAQVLGTTGAIGDYLNGLLIIPATTAAGAVSILDGSTSIQVFAGGGTTALTTLIPWFVPLGAKSTTGPWKVTTGANVSVIAVGSFT